MFMEATSSHGFDADQAKSRRRAVYGKLAEVTVSAGSYEAKLELLASRILEMDGTVEWLSALSCDRFFRLHVCQRQP